MNFEKKIKELEKITDQLAGGELSLEDSLKFFEKGVQLSRQCLKELNQSEKKVQQLIEINEDGKYQTKDFEDEENSI